MTDKIFNVNATEKELRDLIMCRWGDLDNLAGSACTNDTTEEMIERLSKARGLLNTIQYFVEELQGAYEAEEEVQ